MKNMFMSFSLNLGNLHIIPTLSVIIPICWWSHIVKSWWTSHGDLLPASASAVFVEASSQFQHSETAHFHRGFAVSWPKNCAGKRWIYTKHTFAHTVDGCEILTSAKWCLKPVTWAIWCWIVLNIAPSWSTKMRWFKTGGQPPNCSGQMIYRNLTRRPNDQCWDWGNHRRVATIFDVGIILCKSQYNLILFAQALANIPDLHVIKWRIFMIFVYQVQFRWFAALHWSPRHRFLTSSSHSLTHDSCVDEASVAKLRWEKWMIWLWLHSVCIIYIYRVYILYIAYAYAHM